MFNILKKILDFLSTKKSVSARVSTMVTRDWQEIDILIKGGAPSQLKQALITADRSLDSVLRETSEGEGMAKRLINAQNRFDPQTYQKIWDAHKLRNALVHESGFEIQHFVLKAAVENLRRGLRELGIKV